MSDKPETPIDEANVDASASEVSEDLEADASDIVGGGPISDIKGESQDGPKLGGL